MGRKRGAGNRRISLNSFFAGIGGFELGFRIVPSDVLLQCEIDDFCRRVLSKQFRSGEIKRDIRDLKASEIPDADVWTAGFPCQDVSLARGPKGREGLEGKKTGLFFDFIDLVAQKLPQVVLLENVNGLRNSNGGKDFWVVLNALQSMGYAVAWRQLNSRYFGSPQSRPRVFVVCWKGKPSKAVASLFQQAKSPKPRNTTRDFRQPCAKASDGAIVPRISYCLSATAGRHTGMDWSKTYVVVPDGVRRLTPGEYERIQGFPDGWTLTGEDGESESLRYRAIGNAVTVPVVEWIAKRIHRCFQGQDGSESEPRDWLRSIHDATTEFDPNDIEPLGREPGTRRWPSGGIVWQGELLAGRISPSPVDTVESSLGELVSSEGVDNRYSISPNAARGIIKRVDKQGRSLFPPLRESLEELAQQT